MDTGVGCRWRCSPAGPLAPTSFSLPTKVMSQPWRGRDGRRELTMRQEVCSSELCLFSNQPLHGPNVQSGQGARCSCPRSALSHSAWGDRQGGNWNSCVVPLTPGLDVKPSLLTGASMARGGIRKHRSPAIREEGQGR